MSTTNPASEVARTEGPNRSNPATDMPANPPPVPKWQETISIPRWVVYAQGALLGVGGTFFFLFGILVGHFSNSNNGVVSATFDCRVSGSVAYRVDGDLKADNGAVIFFLPADRQPEDRADGNLVNPDTFEARDNIAIDQIHELGGAVVTANADGQFDVVIDASYGNGREFFVLVVSKNKRGVDTAQITKKQNATISSFFAPVESVIEDRSYFWMKLTADQEKIGLPEFEL